MTQATDASLAALAQGFTLEAEDRTVEAFAAYQRAAALDERNGRAWRQMGHLLRRAGRLAEAGECFERARDAGDDVALNDFFLSALGVGPIVPIAPAGFVETLFDQYAPRFDDHLVKALRYEAPERLAGLIAHAGGPRFERMLDIGCGTGLAGLAFRELAQHMVGVDVSTAMLARAQARGVYDDVVQSELHAHLAHTPQRHDLVVACDVLIYIGDLRPLFAGVRRVLRPGGSFAFTVETSDAAEGIDLLPHLRYAHAEPYVARLADEFGFERRAWQRSVLRYEDERPVQGLLVHLIASPREGLLALREGSRDSAKRRRKGAKRRI